MGVSSPGGLHDVLVDDVSHLVPVSLRHELKRRLTPCRQVGMILGFATAYPSNWLLIKYKIKEPCV